jgi:hypothetical protein
MLPILATLAACAELALRTDDAATQPERAPAVSAVTCDEVRRMADIGVSEPNILESIRSGGARTTDLARRYLDECLGRADPASTAP